ncbi:MAG: hypothetical protein SGI89_11130 [bacterium]|nr:hypothetical protein [bacterium]
MRKSILLTMLLWARLIFTQESVNTNPIPYAEGSTSNYEVVIAYNDVEPNKQSKLTIYISDFKTNVPVGNAKLELDITGIDNTKINILPTIDPGIYEALVEFPEIKKYNFLLNITSDETNDLVAINDVDIGSIQEVSAEEEESKSLFVIIKENLLFIIILMLILVLIAFVFYRIGRYKKSNLNLNSDTKNILKELEL